MRRSLMIAALITCVAAPLWAARGARPNANESAALAAIKGKIKGTIVWASNRTGQWELYLMNADGTNARRLTSLAAPGDALAYQSYLRPRFSPDGSLILFAYGKKGAPVEAWVIPSAGGEPRKCTAGNPLNWMPDGKSFVLLRAKQIWRYYIETGEEELAHPAVLPSATDGAGMVGQVRADLTAGVFRFNKNEYIVFDGAKTIKTTDGCEPSLSPDGRYMFWVQGPKNFRVWDILNDTEHELLGIPPVEPFNYTYCPTVTWDGNYLLYGASPSQHSHTTSDYEIYIQPLTDLRADGTPVRLSFNTGTDRWPFLWPGRIGPANGPYDVAGNLATNPPEPPPPPIAIASFGSDGATPDWGGQSGLWPQVEGCKAEVSFVPGDDPETGKGGSVAISYSIVDEPRSFAMWFTPNAPVDLARHDRFVIYARGDVPSFTLVVKDATADPEGKTEVGIADYLVDGVTASWQRFELPFVDFEPRVQGGAIDWSRLNHAAVALIQPANAASGRLHVDNLRAMPTAAQ